MATGAKSTLGWVVLATFTLGVGGKVVATSMFVQDLASRVLGLEKARSEDREDLKYIRGRVDEIRDRLPIKEK